MPPRKKTEAPQVDTTGDLLAAAPGTELTTAAVSDLSALAMVTMDPAKYVATIYEPYRKKFDQLRADADLIALEDDEYKLMVEQQEALPEEERRQVTLVDVSTKEGMAIAVKMRAGFRDEVRLDAEKTRKARKEPILTIGRLLDGEYAKLTDESRPYESRFDAAITAEVERKAREKAEAERIEAERKAKIRATLDAIQVLPGTLASASSATLVEELEKLAAREVTAEEFGDQLGEAALIVDTVGSALASLLDAALAREAAEIRRKREQAEEADRLAKQAEENQRQADELAQQKAAIDAAAAAQAEAMERMQDQMRIQQNAMDEIQALNMVAAASEGESLALYHIQRRLERKVVDEATFGALAPMAQMAKDMAIKALQAKIDQRAAEEIAAYLYDEAVAENAAMDRVLDTALDQVAAAEPEPEPEPLVAPAAPAATIPRPDDSAAVQQFKQVVRLLRGTRTAEEVADLLAVELEEIAAENAKRYAKMYG